ncbi:MAG: hypothetical protein IPP40_08465 [bacterium]|nr:hypothetical protein [bacterium]
MRILLLGLLWLFSGCAHTFTIEKNAPPQKYVEAQNFLHQRPARLFTKAGKLMRVTDWHIGPDSTVFRIDGATDRIVMLNDRIRTLTTQNSRRGMRDGAMIGGFSGGILGLFIGSIAASIQEGCYDCEDRNGGAIILSGLGIGAGIGAVTGALIGTHTGAMRTVEFYKDPHDPRRWEYLPR